MSETKSVTDLKDGDRCIVLLSVCCSATMKGVEHGDHMACRKCREVNRAWAEFVAPFRSQNFLVLASGDIIDVGAGPDYSAAKAIETATPTHGFWWG